MKAAKSPTTKPRRKAKTRIPLIDLSNIIPLSLSSSQSSSSSVIKPQTKSALSLPLKSLPTDPNSHLNPKSKLTATKFTTNNNDNSYNDKKKENEKCLSNKANPSSKLSPPSQTPSVSVYGRHTAEKRKNKGKEIAEPLSCIFETRISDLRKMKDGDDNIGISKSCPMPRKKKQRGVKAEINTPMHNLSQDFIDKQRAYFAEVDAFELEEEVASGDESN